MHVVLYTHPDFQGFVSQQRFAQQLAKGLVQRGVTVQLRQPRALFRRWFQRGFAGSVAAAVDQYLLFPLQQLAVQRRDGADTLYVFCDQAQGPWIPQVARRPHVVHCHDFLALRAALGLVPPQHLAAPSRWLQRAIRLGFQQARCFVSVSAATREDLHRLGGVPAVVSVSEVVPNAVAPDFCCMTPAVARARLAAAGLSFDGPPPLLHVGSDAWYKNSAGVLHLYAAHVRAARRGGTLPRALWLVSPPATGAAAEVLRALPPGSQLRYLQALPDEVLAALYASAALLLFPSLHEGFGWPIAEALGCGCPVLTTQRAPMTEVGGPVAHYLPPMPQGAAGQAKAEVQADVRAWADAGAQRIQAVLSRSAAQQVADADAAVVWAQRFAQEPWLDACLAVYRRAAHAAPTHPVAAAAKARI